MFLFACFVELLMFDFLPHSHQIEQNQTIKWIFNEWQSLLLNDYVQNVIFIFFILFIYLFIHFLFVFIFIYLFIYLFELLQLIVFSVCMFCKKSDFIKALWSI